MLGADQKDYGIKISKIFLQLEQTENNIYNSVYVNCNGNTVVTNIPYLGSQTFCAAFTQPYTYITVTGGDNNCVGGVCP